MKKLYYVKLVLLSLVVTIAQAAQRPTAVGLVGAHFGSALEKSRDKNDRSCLEGPYQDISGAGGVDTLQYKLQAGTELPKVIIEIIASYFFYRDQQKLIIYQDTYARSVIQKPISYSIFMNHADKSVILGSELIGSVEKESRLPRACFVLQEWSKGDERYAENHNVLTTTPYDLSTIHRYTFGIDIRKGMAPQVHSLQKKTRKKEVISSHGCLIA